MRQLLSVAEVAERLRVSQSLVYKMIERRRVPAIRIGRCVQVDPRALEETLRSPGWTDLPNIPFHSEPLMNGHKDYEFLNIEQRKVMLAYFSSFVRKLPISYITFVYRRSQFEDPARLMERMGRDISSAMVEHLGFFQSFDDVRAYYDNDQDIVKQALDRSVGKVPFQGGRPTPQNLDDRLPSRASGDYLCTIKLALAKYETKEDGETYNKFFGDIGSFKRNWLKQARSKRI